METLKEFFFYSGRFYLIYKNKKAKTVRLGFFYFFQNFRIIPHQPNELKILLAMNSEHTQIVCSHTYFFF